MPKIIGIKEGIEKPYNPEDAVERNENNTPETPAAMTIDAIEAFFIQQGNLIEGQLKAEDAHKNCPVCAAAKEFLASMGKMLESSLRRLDETRKISEHASMAEDSTNYAVAFALLKRDNEWYDLARTALINLLQSGHKPEGVMRQHPELAVTKHQKREIRSGKHRRQLAREARRNNR